jgi:hypothetical protein
MGNGKEKQLKTDFNKFIKEFVPAYEAAPIRTQVVTQGNFNELFWKRAGKRFVSAVPETLEAVKMMAAHPITTTRVIWDEIKRNPKEMVKNITVLYPLGQALGEEAFAYHLSTDPTVSSEEKLKALNEAADKFGNVMFGLVSAIGAAKVGSVVKELGPVKRFTDASKTNLAEFFKHMQENIKRMKAPPQLLENAIESGEILSAPSRGAVIPKDSGSLVSKLSFWRKGVKTAVLIDVNDASALNSRYSKELVDKAIDVLNKTTQREFKAAGLRYGWEEQMFGLMDDAKKVSEVCRDLPRIISDEVYSKTGVRLTVKVGVAKITKRAKAVLDVDRATGLSKVAGRPIVWTEDLERFMTAKGEWQSAARGFAKQNGFDPARFIEFVVKERARVPLDKVFNKKFIRATERLINDSERSAVQYALEGKTTIHDPLNITVPSGSMSRKITVALSQDGEFSILKFSPSLEGIEKLSPQYAKLAKRLGTMKFLNDGTLSAYLGGDAGACGVTRAGNQVALKYGAKFVTRWDGLGDELTAPFGKHISDPVANKFAEEVAVLMNQNLSKEALASGVNYQVLVTYANAPKGTAINGVLKEAGEKLAALKASRR